MCIEKPGEEEREETWKERDLETENFDDRETCKKLSLTKH